MLPPIFSVILSLVTKAIMLFLQSSFREFSRSEIDRPECTYLSEKSTPAEIFKQILFSIYEFRIDHNRDIDIYVIGSHIMMSLLFFRIYTAFILGNNYYHGVTVYFNQTRIKRGPYRLLNHPEYYSMMLGTFVYSLTIGMNPVAIFFLMQYEIGSYKLRIELEDTLMNEYLRRDE